jgi:alpha-L-rhamnosidase
MRHRPGPLAPMLLLVVAFPASAAPSEVTVTDLRTEYTENPLGIDALRPRLSWKLRASARRRDAVRVRVARRSHRARTESGLGSRLELGPRRIR